LKTSVEPLSKDDEADIPQSIMLIDTRAGRRSVLAQALERNGYTLVYVSETAENLSELAQAYQPDVIVIGVSGPDSNTLANLTDLNKNRPAPVVVFAEEDAPQVIQQTIKTGVSAYIVDDIQEHRMKSIITVAYLRFIEQQKVKAELAKSQYALASRIVLEKAKGLLMAQRGINEEQAFQLIRKMAMDKGLSIGKVAGDIIDLMALMALD